MLVLTTKGLVDRSLLTARDVVIETDDARSLVTEWYLDGELVMRANIVQRVFVPDSTGRRGLTTTKGVIDRALLEVSDIATEEETCRTVATEWRLDGEIVSRDVSVCVLTGMEALTEQMVF